MMNSIRYLTYAVVLSLTSCASADDQNAVGGYCSELWKMEFHRDKEGKPEPPQQPDELAAEGAAPVAVAPTNSALDQLVANSVASGNACTASSMVLGMSESASEGAGRSGTDNGRAYPDRRQGSVRQSISSQRDSEEEFDRKGPSALTIFVALAAGIVLTSAVFSKGR